MTWTFQARCLPETTLSSQRSCRNTASPLRHHLMCSAVRTLSILKHIQGSRIRFVLGCVIPRAGAVARSRNLGQALFGSPVRRKVLDELMYFSLQAIAHAVSIDRDIHETLPLLCLSEILSGVRKIHIRPECACRKQNPEFHRGTNLVAVPDLVARAVHFPHCPVDPSFISSVR